MAGRISGLNLTDLIASAVNDDLNAADDVHRAKLIAIRAFENPASLAIDKERVHRVARRCQVRRKLDVHSRRQISGLTPTLREDLIAERVRLLQDEIERVANDREDWGAVPVGRGHRVAVGGRLDPARIEPMIGRAQESGVLHQRVVQREPGWMAALQQGMTRFQNGEPHALVGVRQPIDHPRVAWRLRPRREDGVGGEVVDSSWSISIWHESPTCNTLLDTSCRAEPSHRRPKCAWPRPGRSKGPACGRSFTYMGESERNQSTALTTPPLDRHFRRPSCKRL